ncbi:MAG: pyroglutamyl-peptidase I [Salaquimonas sp.]|jgi:pyroglutamyl-peptidase|nr:pyroglutamyl-peptidase I [Salaquimonas sp.]
MREVPRILVTGFGPFPGAPQNPTQALVEHLRADPPAFEGLGAFHAECLDVDYEAIAPRLSAIGREFAPDIAIHFGLAASCSGFRLERVARNRHAQAQPDNRGALPASGAICAGPETLSSRLPLDAIAAALGNAGLPVEWSDDAGSYLCNTVMTLSLAHACECFAPLMSGFVHVPLPGAGPEEDRMAFDDLAVGTTLIVETCAREWLACAK